MCKDETKNIKFIIRSITLNHIPRCNISSLHNCKESNFLGVWRIFAQISPELLCGFCLQIFSHKNHEHPFLVCAPKKALHLFFCKSWAPFLKWNNVGHHLCPDFAKIFREFAQIFDKSKLFVVCVHPHLHHCHFVWYIRKPHCQFVWYIRWEPHGVQQQYMLDFGSSSAAGIVSRLA